MHLRRQATNLGINLGIAGDPVTIIKDMQIEFVPNERSQNMPGTQLTWSHRAVCDVVASHWYIVDTLHCCNKMEHSMLQIEVLVQCAAIGLILLVRLDT